MAASGPVEVTQADGSKLTCNRLDVGFTHPTSASEQPKPSVIVASGDALYNGKADGKQTVLAAETLSIDALKNHLTLTGSAEKPASFEAEGMTLSGPTVYLEKEAGVAQVAGPGHLTVLTTDKADQTPQHLTVSWQGRMGWNNTKGRGYFEKQVDCAADSADGDSTLHADDSLELRVDPAAQVKGDGPEAKRDIRLADARGKVVFTGEQKDAQGGRVGNVANQRPQSAAQKRSATAASPRAPQTVTVTGKGLMLVQNFQKKTATTAKARSPAQAPPPSPGPRACRWMWPRTTCTC